VKFNKNIKNWSISGEISAGNYIHSDINDLSAVHIMTGAKIPDNFDTVIPVEDLIIRENEIILNTNARYSFGMNVRKKGEDLPKNSLAIKKGTFLKPQHIALAAACGKSHIKIYDKLKYGILTTGDELVDINEIPENDKIRASNLYTLIAAVKEIGQTPVNLGIVKDDRENIKEKISSSLNSDIDVLITTGGVSVGKYDYVKDIFEEIGITKKFHKVNIRPGKPVLYGTFQKKEKTVLIFALPGNPVSALVTFNLFIKDILLSGYNNSELVRINAKLSDDIDKSDSKRHFIRGELRNSSDGLIVSLVGNQSSGNLAQMSKANCLIVIEEDRINPRKGENAECIMI
ncbi:MAG: molybdopterin molybdotransferase MoeA, partial [Bacteroidota bacterium]|nr:molybdopterin molybdotransferase MoeA [Bacteroidota bacterium]